MCVRSGGARGRSASEERTRKRVGGKARRLTSRALGTHDLGEDEREDVED